MPILRSITAPDGTTSEWPEGTPLGEIVAAITAPRSSRRASRASASRASPSRASRASASPDGRAALGLPPPIAALLENNLVSLSDPLEFGGAIRPVYPRDPHGIRVMQRTACFLLSMAVHRAAPKAHFRIHADCGPGVFFTLDPAIPDLPRRFQDLVRADLPIQRTKAPYLAALAGFESHGLLDKARLLRHRSSPAVPLAKCDDFLDLWQGVLAPRTSACAEVRIAKCDGGWLLQLPLPDDPVGAGPVPRRRPDPALLAIAREHIRWAEIIGVQTVGQLNEAVASDGGTAVLRMAEALHDQRLSDIARDIAMRPTPVRLVLIAGPSSAGKTTTARRLVTHLRVYGMRPLLLSTDDYFFGIADTVHDESGAPDFEHIEAIDLAALNADLAELLAGRAIRRRVFDFHAQAPTFPGGELALPPGGILVMEGLHCLNPRLTAQIPDADKFHIFLNDMTQPGLDENNRVSTTDARLLRRLVRDHRTRGKDALGTLRMWPSVRRGEGRWIFPFQKRADAVFNTALDYELAVIKPLAEPILATVKPDVPEYADARRLLALLANFHPMSSRLVPSDSILRETLGGGLFED